MHGFQGLLRAASPSWRQELLHQVDHAGNLNRMGGMKPLLVWSPRTRLEGHDSLVLYPFSHCRDVIYAEAEEHSLHEYRLHLKMGRGLERRSNHKQPSVWGFPLSETIQRCHFRCMMLSRKGNGAGRRTRGSNLRICETSAT